MSSAKCNESRPAQRWFKTQQAPAARHGRGNWVVRWIGAAKRRASKTVDASTIEAPSARIIQLSWADTLGRPARIERTGIFRPPGTIVRLLPH